ncbi:MAG TPA: hypothetical protein VJM51_04555 [Dehalococcoidia bacterium]|nr:hypothetical protein [Dehalococcoidia bacterium]
MASTTTDLSLPAYRTGRQAQPRTLWRLALWSGLLVLTSLILAYPVNLRLDPYVVWSPDIFPNLPLFGALFYLWTACLLVLLFTPSNDGVVVWERLTLVALAALVFRGLWGIIVPLQGQAFAHVIASKVWQSIGHVVPNPAAAYISWPGVSLDISVVSQITGLELFPSGTILTVFISVAVGIATYVFLLGVLESSFYAALGSLLIIAGDLAMVIHITAGPTALVFVVLFLALLFQRGSLGTPARMGVALVLLTGAALTHLHSAMHFFFFLVGLWSLALLGARTTVFRPTVTTMMLFFLIPVAWIVYWGTAGFAWIVRGGSVFLSDPLDLWERLAGVFTVGETNFGPSAPLWYSFTRWSWLAVLYTAGGLVWLWKLTRLRRLVAAEVGLAATFAGLVLMNAISSLVSPRGFGELLRGLTYVPFFTAPFLLLFLRQRNPLVTKAIVAGLAAMLFALSLPTFLAGNRYVNLLAHHQTEFAAGGWLQSLYGTGQGLNVFLTHPIFQAIQISLLDAVLTSDEAADTAGYTKQAAWQAVDTLLEGFDQLSQYSHPALFIDSAKIAVASSITFDIPADHPRWQEMRDHLAKRNAKIYDNGAIVVYSAIH